MGFFFVLIVLFYVVFLVLVLSVTIGLMALFNKPKGIRPAWWDWGLDDPAINQIEPEKEPENDV